MRGTGLLFRTPRKRPQQHFKQRWSLLTRLQDVLLLSVEENQVNESEMRPLELRSAKGCQAAILIMAEPA